jgi:hypothetical protein
MQLAGVDSLPALAQKPDHVEPLVQGDVGALERGSHGDGVLLSATFALVHAASNRTSGSDMFAEFHRSRVMAVRTNGAVRPSNLFEISPSLIVGGMRTDAC